MSKARILVVEDNLDNKMLIGDFLTLLGYDLIYAQDGEQAIAQAAAEQPDLILMDLSLPLLDGWEATRAIRANPDLPQMPIIALTAHAMIGDRERALAAGCNDYVSKPIDFKELTGKLRHFLA